MCSDALRGEQRGHGFPARSLASSVSGRGFSADLRIPGLVSVNFVFAARTDFSPTYACICNLVMMMKKFIYLMDFLGKKLL